MGKRSNPLIMISMVVIISILALLAMIFMFNPSLACSLQGGKFVDVSEIEGWQIGLGIKNTNDCVRYGGICTAPEDSRPISTTVVGHCDDRREDCLMPDFYEDTCLMPKPISSVPNPAAINCADAGGISEVREFPFYHNQVGICVFSDGSECVEWALFNGDCVQGQHNQIRLGWECSINHGCSDENWNILDDALGMRPRKIYSEEGYDDIVAKAYLVNQCCEPVVECL